MDRFGACSPCPTEGMICNNDTAILAPDHYWRWVNKTHEDQYQKFVENIAVEGPSYDSAYSRFNGSLPIAHRCIRQNACLGGLKSECNDGYTGLLCSRCKSGYYLRMNTCEKCPTKFKAVLLVVDVLIAFILVMTAVIWGDSKRVAHNRTWADVILSRFKIIISFYQVIMGVFSALARVKWPAPVVVMTRWLRYAEANILELGPLSCIDPRLRFDPLQQFALAVSLNAGVVLAFLVYLKIRRVLINWKKDISIVEKREALSASRKSCYRNIFLFLFTTYPSTSVKIVQITPPACISLRFSTHETQCSSFLLSDLAIQCFTSRYNTYSLFAMVLLLYPVGFPVLVLGLLWKFCHKQSERPAHSNMQNPSEDTSTLQNHIGHVTYGSDEPSVSTDQQVPPESTRTVQDRTSHYEYGSDKPTVSTGLSSPRSSEYWATDSTDGSVPDDAEPNDEISGTDRSLHSLPVAPHE